MRQLPPLTACPIDVQNRIDEPIGGQIGRRPRFARLGNRQLESLAIVRPSNRWDTARYIVMAPSSLT